MEIINYKTELLTISSADHYFAENCYECGCELTYRSCRVSFVSVGQLGCQIERSQ